MFYYIRFNGKTFLMAKLWGLEAKFDDDHGLLLDHRKLQADWLCPGSENASPQVQENNAAMLSMVTTMLTVGTESHGGLKPLRDINNSKRSGAGLYRG
jgi:hypothetical protein